MMKKYRKSDLLEVANNDAKPPNCDIILQIKTTYASEGVSKGVWEVDEKFYNGNGVSMGGFLSSAADIMMAYAIASRLEENQTFASINLQTTFHRPVFIGTVEVSAKVDRIGKKMAYLTAELIQNGKKVANAVSSVMIIEEEERN